MTSYQKLKHKNEHLQQIVNLFKNCLTIGSNIETTENDDGSIRFTEKFYVQRTKLLNEFEKEELTRWVAFNLDEKLVLRLLEIKKELKE